jgi:hypothetical protein
VTETVTNVGNESATPRLQRPAAEVRVATREDEEQLLGLLEQMHAEGGLQPLSIHRAQEIFAKAFDRKGGIIGAIGPQGDIEAAIGLLINSFWYTDANRRQFDMVMAWSVDRLGRSLQDLVCFLSELHALGIDLMLHQQGLNGLTASVTECSK